MFRRKLFEMVGGYHAYFRYTQDYDLWLRMARHTRMANLAERLYITRHTRTMISHKHLLDQMDYHFVAQAADEYRSKNNGKELIAYAESRQPGQLLKEELPEFWREVQEEKSRRLWSRFYHALAIPNHRNALRLGFFAFRTKPEKWRLRWASKCIFNEMLVRLKKK